MVAPRCRQAQQYRAKRCCVRSEDEADLEVRRVAAILCLCVERQPESICIWTAKLCRDTVPFLALCNCVSVACTPESLASHGGAVHFDKSNVGTFMRKPRLICSSCSLGKALGEGDMVRCDGQGMTRCRRHPCCLNFPFWIYNSGISRGKEGKIHGLFR